MRSKHAITWNKLMGAIFAVVISIFESLALFDSASDPSQFLLTPPVPFLPFPLFSNVTRILPLQVNTTNSTTSSSSQSATANFVTGISVPESPIITSANVETGYLASLPSATNLATGSTALQSSAIKTATGFSASQSTTSNYATGSSTSQSATTNLSKGSSTENELATRSSTLQTSVSGANNIQYPVAANSIAQQFSNSISQSLVALEIFKNFADFEMEQHKELFFDYDTKILTNAGIQDLYLAEVVGKALEPLDVLSAPIFFTAVTNTLAKFLFSKGVLTNDTAPSLSQKFLDLVHFHGDSNGIDSSESLVVAVGDGFFEFVSSLGLLKSEEDFVQLFHLFAQELKIASL